MDDLSQSLKYKRASIILGVKVFRNASKTRPPILNADSEAMVEIGTAQTS